MDAQEITTRLPPWREDEPVSLRQEIVDEILDHLQCGLRRELLVQGGDETAAKQRVLNRFGDPREVARKLWFQAMRSQIMSQRIVIGSALFSMVVCAALVGMMVWIMQQQQQANAAMIEQIVKLIPQPVPPVEPQPQLNRDPQKSWLQVKLTMGSKDGPPANVRYIMIKKLFEIDQEMKTANSVSIPVNQQGIADCGFTSPGRFQVTFSSHLRESVDVIFAMPDMVTHKNYVEHIVVPDGTPEMTKINFQMGELPDELENSSLKLVARLVPNSIRVFEGNTWTRFGQWPNIPAPLILLSKSEGMRLTVEPEEAKSQQGNVNWIPLINRLIQHGDWESPHEWSLPSGKYVVQFGLVNCGDPLEPPWNEIGKNSDELQKGVWLRSSTYIVAEPGKINELVIELPAWLNASIRDRSKIPQYVDYSNHQMGGGGGGGFF